MAEFTPEEQKIIKQRREVLAPIYGDDAKAMSDAEILALTEEGIVDLLTKSEPPAITKADLEALYQVIERQGKALDAFAKKIESQDQAIGTVNQSIKQVAEAVTPLIKTFNEFAPKADSDGSAAPAGAVVHHNGNGGGKMDMMLLLNNPLVQKMLLGGGEQANPLQAVLSQVQFVAELKQNLDSIGGRGGGINHPKNSNWDRSDFLEGMRWAWRMKNGKMPAELINALTNEDDDDGKAPRVIFIQQPEDVKHRRDPGEHRI